MFLPVVLLALAAVLQQSLGQGHEGIVAIITEEVQNEIVDKHNEIRRWVQPTASNMLKITWSKKAAEIAKKSTEKCQARTTSKNDLTVDGTFCIQNVFQANLLASWSDAIQVWYNARSNFEFGIGAIHPSKEIGVYTQNYTLVINILHCSDFRGNIVDQLPTPYKEGPSCGDCPYDCEDKLCSRLLMTESNSSG
ncbi:cysteine-rich venom protein 2-like [Rhineura floridana]|uniref:cysteine-rich venom protein 2-like n=1 Tax=Rhineura floridana TaxID=261503 RepID=UPI002AC852E8|nr:cysteine-rich venom protein 2-like [Rhineura floridana]